MPKSTSKNHKKLYARIVAAAIIASVILVTLFILFVYRVPQYSYYYVKCGFKQPVKVINYASQTYGYILPSSQSYEETKLFISGFYCSEQEAIHAGIQLYDL